MHYDNMEKNEVLKFIKKDPSCHCTLFLLRLSEKTSLNFLTKSVVLIVFLRIAKVSQLNSYQK